MHFKKYLLITTISLSIITPLTVISEENENTDKLVEIAMTCGDGDIYFSTKSNYTSQSWKWLKSLLGYLHSGHHIGEFDFDSYVDDIDRISVEQINSISTESGFSEWLGDTGTKLLNEFTKARETLFLNSLVKSYSNNSEEFYKDARLINYYETQSKFEKFLINKFKLIVKDNGNHSCE